MKYQRAKVSGYRYGEWMTILTTREDWHDTPDHDIPHTVIEAIAAMPNMPVMIGGYLYRVIS